ELPVLVSGEFDGSGLTIVFRPPGGCVPEGYFVTTSTSPGGVLIVEHLVYGPGVPGAEEGTRCIYSPLDRVPFAEAAGHAVVGIAAGVLSSGVSRGQAQISAMPTVAP